MILERSTSWRLGLSVVETLVVLLLTLLLIAILAPLLARHRQAAEAIVARMEEVATRRVARDFTGRIVHGGGAPWVEGADGPVRIRRFVGFGIPCAPGAWEIVGERSIRVGEDSVWVVFADGRQAAGPIEGESGEDCPGTGSASASRLATPAFSGHPAEPVLVRIFEAGRIAVSDAFRYGRPGDPAQPLTAANLDPGRSRLGLLDGVLGLVLTHPADSLPSQASWTGATYP